MLMLFKKIYDLRKRYGALFRLLHLNHLVDLRGEIQRLQYFGIKQWKLFSVLISIVGFSESGRTAHHSE